MSSEFLESVARFNRVVEDMIASESFTHEDLAAPLTAILILFREQTLAELSRLGVFKYLAESNESIKSISLKLAFFRILDNGYVRLKTVEGDDLLLSTPTFREIIERDLIAKEHPLYWLVLVYLYINGEEPVIAHFIKGKLEKPLI